MSKRKTRIRNILSVILTASVLLHTNLVVADPLTPEKAGISEVNSISEQSVSMESVMSGNAISDNMGVSDDAVSDNSSVSDDSVSDDDVISDNAVSDNAPDITPSEDTVSENTISEDAVSGNYAEENAGIEGTITVSGGEAGIDYEWTENTLTVKSGKPLKIKGDGNENTQIGIVLGDKNNSTDINVTIEDLFLSPRKNAPISVPYGYDKDVNLTLSGQNTLNGWYNFAGLEYMSETSHTGSLTISGNGELVAVGGSDSAGIGASKGKNNNASGPLVSNIIIKGGKISAIGVTGIGTTRWSYGSSEYTYGKCSNIVIEGGNIKAIGLNGAGIGGCIGGNASRITINGGTITASGNVGIGAGEGGTASLITVSGGDITALGKVAGIGGSSVSDIKIYGGKIYCRAAMYEDILFRSTGIGAGYEYGSCNGIYIYDGDIYAEGGAGIGGGDNCKNIVIYGGNIEAIGQERAVIGSLLNTASGIVVNGGILNLTDNKYGAGIGGGKYKPGSDTENNITINGGIIKIKMFFNREDGPCAIGGASEENCLQKSDITINGGTIITNGSIGYTKYGYSEHQDKISIYGGSINGSIKEQNLQKINEKDVFLKKITGCNPYEKYPFPTIEGADYYSLKDVVADEKGSFYLYLPKDVLADVDRICKVNYVTYTDAAIPNVIIYNGTKLSEPEKLTREGYDFLGWSTKEGSMSKDDFWEFTRGVYKSMTLYAVWEKEIPYTRTALADTFTAGEKINIKNTYFKDIYDISRFRTVLADTGENGKKYATVSPKGVLTAKKAGKITIIPQRKLSKKVYEDIEGASCNITILPKPKLKFKKILTYNGHKIWAYSYLSKDWDKNDMEMYEWKSSKPRVVSVDKKGYLTANKPGTATITGYLCKKNANGYRNTVKCSATITVKFPKFESSSYNVKKGKKKTITIKNVTTSMNPVWSISGNDIIDILPKTNKYGLSTNKAVVRGLKKGNTDLSVIIDGQKYETNIVVK